MELTALPLVVIDGRTSQPFMYPPSSIYTEAVPEVRHLCNQNLMISNSHNNNNNNNNNSGGTGNVREPPQTLQNATPAPQQPEMMDVDNNEIDEEILLRALAAVENNEDVVLDWPRRGTERLSEFKTTGFFTKAFPALFPTGAGMPFCHQDLSPSFTNKKITLFLHLPGDITSPRLGKNPTMADYFQHLLKVLQIFYPPHVLLPQ